MSKKQKLELTWIGKEHRPKLEPRILIEDPTKSHHAKQRVTDTDLFDNRLIFGDNLLALKALEQEFTGKIKCIFIDPPYNTGSAFTHYDDGVEHSIWLSLMRERLECLRGLLSKDGSIWISIDDNEAHYLKVLCDEVFGRNNFIGNIIWHKKYSPQNDDKGVTTAHDHILAYSKQKESLSVNLLPRTTEMDARYDKDDGDGKGPWKSGDLTSKTKAKGHSYPIVGPNGQTHLPSPGRQWAPSQNTFNRWMSENKIWFGPRGNSRPSIKQYLNEVQAGIVPLSIWFRDEVGDNQEAKREVIAHNSEVVFDTPKPERLIQRVITISTNAGDLVLDSFLGSGTTAAVAHKMGRRWIGIELGDHCHTHCLPRLTKVVDGEDAGGITEAVGWKGGGGFRYYNLAPSLLAQDKWGQWVISQEYNASMLAEAVCKLEGFSYAPNDTLYWQHGYSTERDFIYTTTANLNHDQLQQLSEEVGEDRSLLVVCSSFRGLKEGYPNLTVKKIPKAVLGRCEWGKDDYSLKVENLPKAQPKISQKTLFEGGGAL
jgi:adenine-specific DNA-methyltransferase